MKLDELKKCEYGLTHDGTFHADDVFSTAFIKIINPNIKIIRSNIVPENFKGIVYDVGLGEFDHHSHDNEVRANGIPYAAFGKLWRRYARELYGEYVYEKIDKTLIEHLDLSDNTGVADSLCVAISAFNPKDEYDIVDKCFEDAILIAEQILKRLIKKEQINYIEEMQVREIYNKSSNKEIIILDSHLHFSDTLPKTKAIYVIFPSNRGGYCAQGVSINSDTVELKKPFPKRWTVKLPKYLRFCHSSRFLIVGETLEDVLHACNIALKE